MKRVYITRKSLILILGLFFVVCCTMLIWPGLLLWPQNWFRSAPVIFPSNRQIIEYYGMFLISGPLFLVIGAGLYLVNSQQKTTNKKMQFVGVSFVVIGLCHLFIIYPTAIIDLVFRFDVTKVSELKIERLNEKVKCQPLIIKDKQVIQDGLQELEAASGLWLSHTSFSNEEGYRIQITSNDFRPHYQYLTVYYKNGQGKEAQALVPQLYVFNTTYQRGYKSPEFYRWVNDNVTSIFEDCLN